MKTRRARTSHAIARTQKTMARMRFVFALLLSASLAAGVAFAAADLAAGFAAGEEGAAESTFVIVFGVLETVVFFGAAFFSGASCSGVFFSAMMSLLFSD